MNSSIEQNVAYLRAHPYNPNSFANVHGFSSVRAMSDLNERIFGLMDQINSHSRQRTTIYQKMQKKPSDDHSEALDYSKALEEIARIGAIIAKAQTEIEDLSKQKERMYENPFMPTNPNCLQPNDLSAAQSLISRANIIDTASLEEAGILNRVAQALKYFETKSE